jgi:hypothetical protein
MLTRRKGYQLLELSLSLTTASVLILGLASSLAIATKSLSIASVRESSSFSSESAIARLRQDLAEAYPVQSRSATSVSLLTSDRNGDGSLDRIRYQWSGSAGDPLLRSIDAGPWLEAIRSVEDFRLGWQTQASLPEAAAVPFEPPGALQFQASTIGFGTASTSLSLSIPETYQTGDLLIAVLAVDGNAPAVTASSNWTQAAHRVNESEATLSIFYALAPSGNSLRLDWSGSRSHFGTIAHFATPSGTATLVDSQVASGTGQFAEAAAATATLDHALIIRAVAARGTLQLVEDACKMPGHIAITLRRQLLFNPIVGLAYRYSPAGQVSPENFKLAGSSNYVTATLVFQP